MSAVVDRSPAVDRSAAAVNTSAAAVDTSVAVTCVQLYIFIKYCIINLLQSFFYLLSFATCGLMLLASAVEVMFSFPYGTVVKICIIGSQKPLITFCGYLKVSYD